MMDRAAVAAAGARDRARVFRELDDRRARIVGIPAFGVGIPFLFHLYGPLGAGDARAWLGAALFLALSAAIWHGNRWLLLRSRSSRDWLEHPLRRVAVLVAGIVLYTAPLTVATLAIWERVAGFDVDTRAVTLMNVIAVVFVAHVYETVLLIKDRESDAVLVANAERARAEAELLALRRQIDPHFIFNCLNALQHLITQDPALATTFVRDFAAVTRYLLTTSDKKAVSLVEELDFTKRYASLLAIRFGPAFRLDVRDDGADLAAEVPAGSIQLLVENAVKHNAFHAKQPLVVEVALGRDAVVVANPHRPRDDAAANSTGLGLANLAERVRLATGRALAIEAGAERFVVTIPLPVTSSSTSRGSA